MLGSREFHLNSAIFILVQSCVIIKKEKRKKKKEKRKKKEKKKRKVLGRQVVKPP
jgi:protein subunit release factor B